MRLWKLGARWGANAPLFYPFIKEKNIVISHRNSANPQADDYFLITDGFTVKAIVKAGKPFESITKHPEWEQELTDKYALYFEDDIIYAPVSFWFELSPNQEFRYQNRIGICQIHAKDIIEKTLNLLDRIDMPSIHRKAFEKLLSLQERDESLSFMLNFDEATLKKGYWLLGDDQHCRISFWDAINPSNGLPNIFLNIPMSSNEISLHINAEDETATKIEFCKKIAGFIPDIKNTKALTWVKTYEEENYATLIEQFVNTEKEIIDAFLWKFIASKASSNNTDAAKEFSFINKKVFDKQLEKLLILKQNFNYLPTSKTDSSVNELQLQKLILHNIGHFKHFEMDLSARIICILGDNGVGKTTLLRALALGITGVQNSEINKERLARLLRFDYGEQSGNPNFENEGEIQLNYKMGSSACENIINFTKNSLGQIIIVNKTSSNRSFEINKTDNIYKLPILGFAQVQRKQDASANSITAITAEPNVRDILPLLYDEEDNRFQQLKDWFIKMDGDSTKKDNEAIKFTLKTISQIVGETATLHKISHKEGHVWIKVGERIILFDAFSQGFRNIFAWVGHFIKRMAEASNYEPNFYDKKAILLVDEIDTYLHPVWQRTILDVLVENFPNTQFIVSTHSPLVANHTFAQQEKALVYVVDQHAESPLVYDRTYGRDIRDVFEDWMKVKAIPAEVQLVFNNFYKIVDKIISNPSDVKDEYLAESRKLLEELEDYFEPSDALFVEAKNYLDTAEESLKWAKENPDNHESYS